MAAPRGSVGTCNVSVSCEWDGHGRSVSRSVSRSVGQSVGRSVGQLVSRSVDARGPVDHASVGLARARPNNIVYLCLSCVGTLRTNKGF